MHRWVPWLLQRCPHRYDLLDGGAGWTHTNGWRSLWSINNAKEIFIVIVFKSRRRIDVKIHDIIRGLNTAWFDGWHWVTRLVPVYFLFVYLIRFLKGHGPKVRLWLRHLVIVALREMFREGVILILTRQLRKPLSTTPMRKLITKRSHQISPIRHLQSLIQLRFPQVSIPIIVLDTRNTSCLLWLRYRSSKGLTQPNANSILIDNPKEFDVCLGVVFDLIVFL